MAAKRGGGKDYIHLFPKIPLVGVGSNVHEDKILIIVPYKREESRGMITKIYQEYLQVVTEISRAEVRVISKLTLFDID